MLLKYKVKRSRFVSQVSDSKMCLTLNNFYLLIIYNILLYLVIRFINYRAQYALTNNFYQIST